MWRICTWRSVIGRYGGCPIRLGTAELVIPARGQVRPRLVGSSEPPSSVTSILHPNGLMVGSTAMTPRVARLQISRVNGFLRCRVVRYAYDHNGRRVRSMTLCHPVETKCNLWRQKPACQPRLREDHHLRITSRRQFGSRPNNLYRQQIPGFAYSSSRLRIGFDV